MFFDDRLATVLRQQSSSESAKRTQFRQLLDILGNRKFGSEGRSDQSLVAAAWLRMDALGRSIPAKDRAAMIREPSWRFRSADLAAHLADFEPEVASAALNRAELSSEEWSILIPRLPIRARGFLRLRRDLPLDADALLEKLGVHDRGLPLPDNAADGLPAEGGTILEDETPEPPFEDQEDEPLDLSAEAEIFEDTTEETATPSPRDPEILQPAPAATVSDIGSSTNQRRDPRDPIETGRSEISALVERIAQFRKTREEADALTDSERSPRLPLGEVEAAPSRRANSFGFAADASGRIDWAEPEVAPMVIGIKLAAPQALGETLRSPSIDADIARAFMQRQPIEGARTELTGAPAIAGEWTLDAQPRFTMEGHFIGYVGRFRRLPEEAEDVDAETAQEADRIRQLLHELRTPVTAVQGYAEVIQQQLFGPAPHEYRALAAAIAADAAFILAGFEELDRLARLEVGALSMEPGESDLATLARQTEQQLAQVLAPRMAGLDITLSENTDFTVPLDAEEAERLVWRILATLGGACGASETLKATMEAQGENVLLTCELPAQLAREDDIFATSAKPADTAINAGVFGAGFALRLARAEARASGGNLTSDGARATLTLPRLEQAGEEPILTQA